MAIVEERIRRPESHRQALSTGGSYDIRSIKLSLERAGAGAASGRSADRPTPEEAIADMKTPTTIVVVAQWTRARPAPESLPEFVGARSKWNRRGSPSRAHYLFHARGGPIHSAQGSQVRGPGIYRNVQMKTDRQSGEKTPRAIRPVTIKRPRASAAQPAVEAPRRGRRGQGQLSRVHRPR
jgi:hypothetical protein